MLLIEEIYDRHDINGGRQTRIRIRDKKHPLKSVSEECHENWISQVRVHTRQNIGAVRDGTCKIVKTNFVPCQAASATRREGKRVVSKYPEALKI